MSVVAYEAIISVGDEVANERAAIAEASRRLANAPVPFCYLGEVLDVQVYEGGDGWGIGIHFTTEIRADNTSAVTEYIEERLDNHALIESWEELGYEGVEDDA